MKVIFVGIHNKVNKTPLCSSTRSGELIDRIIKLLPFETQKTNLFNLTFLPIHDEVRNNLADDWWFRIEPNSNDIIVLLGAKVHKYFDNKRDLATIKIAHPSSIWSNKSKVEYVTNSVKLILQKANFSILPIV